MCRPYWKFAACCTTKGSLSRALAGICANTKDIQAARMVELRAGEVQTALIPESARTAKLLAKPAVRHCLRTLQQAIRCRRSAAKCCWIYATLCGRSTRLNSSHLG